MLLKVNVASAKPAGRLESEPIQITSSDFLARKELAACSPNTQRIASVTLLFPDPFGPAMTVIPDPNSNVVRSAKDLNP